ncbi:MAG: NlpC/P60 family protein [Flavobacteriales bacterium]
MNKDSKFIQCIVACVPMYSESQHRSELVNQLLYNEVARVMEERDEWIKVQSGIDKYVGWILKAQTKSINHKVFMQVQSFTNVKRKHDFLMPFGTYMEGTPDGPQNIDQLLKKAFTFLNAPYLWGGKTIFGIDCSGFTQVLFRIVGVSLPRDASMQVEHGEVIPFEERQKGDVAFFKNNQGKVTHVGVLISEESIIHASGTVRIDGINENGIWNSDLGKQTHEYHVIKRML